MKATPDRIEALRAAIAGGQGVQDAARTAGMSKTNAFRLAHRLGFAPSSSRVTSHQRGNYTIRALRGGGFSVHRKSGGLISAALIATCETMAEAEHRELVARDLADQDRTERGGERDPEPRDEYGFDAEANNQGD